MAPELQNVPGGPLEKRPSTQREAFYPAILAAIAFAILIFILIAGTDWLATRRNIPEVTMLVTDAIVAALGGLLLMKLMAGERARVIEARARHDAMVQRLQMIADLNHHVRNALETIQLSAHTTQNKELIQNVHSSVTRIQWALRELLPPDRDTEDNE